MLLFNHQDAMKTVGGFMCRENCSILNIGTVWKNWCYFSPQLSSQTRIAKIENKKVIAKTQCEKHKTSTFFLII